jgi:hypothetical protein
VAFELAKWPYVFGLGEVADECPMALQSLQLALRRRIMPILDKAETKRVICLAQAKLEALNCEELRRDVYEKWEFFPPEESLFAGLVERMLCLAIRVPKRRPMDVIGATKKSPSSRILQITKWRLFKSCLSIKSRLSGRVRAPAMKKHSSHHYTN